MKKAFKKKMTALAIEAFTAANKDGVVRVKLIGFDDIEQEDTFKVQGTVCRSASNDFTMDELIAAGVAVKVALVFE